MAWVLSALVLFPAVTSADVLKKRQPIEDSEMEVIVCAWLDIRQDGRAGQEEGQQQGK
jgi:hypothetical protein